MGHYVGLADKQFYVDDDGKVYGTPAKGQVVAESIEELFGVVPSSPPAPEPVVDPPVDATDDRLTCEICGFRTTKAAMGMHKKKHKGIF